MKGRIMVFLGAASYGILSTIVKVAYEHGFSVAQVVTSQLWLGMLMTWVLVLIFALFGTKMGNVKKDFWGLMLSGVPLGITSYTYYECVQYVPASIAILLLFQFVWIGMVLDWIFRGKQPSKIQLISMLGLLIGTAFAVGILNEQQIDWNLKGVGFGLVSALSYALFLFWSETGKHTHYTIKGALKATAAAFISILIFNPIDGLDGILSNGLLEYGIPLAMFGVLIPPVLFAYGVPKIGTTAASILGAVELPVAVISANLVLSEKVTFSQWLGVFLVLFSITYPQIWALRKQKV